MEQRICPIDGKPCEADCPDRYRDEPAGGCTLTTAVELGAKLIDLSDGDIGILFTPNPGEVCDCREKEKSPAGAVNTDEGGVEQVDKAVSTSIMNATEEKVK